MIFITNKYTKYYFSIINNASQLNRKKLKRNHPEYIYYEKHHIIPKSIGGSNDKINLVLLTAREHFICHWLLIKMITGTYRHKMMYALNGMKRNNKQQNRYETIITSQVYAKLKNQLSLIHSIALTGIKRGLKSSATKEKLSIAHRGKIFTKEHKQHISESKAGCKSKNKGGTTSLLGKTYEQIHGVDKALSLRSIRAVAWNKPKSEATRAIWSANRKGKHTLGDNSNAIPIIFDNISYSSKKEAYTTLGISEYKFNKLIKR